MGNSITIQQLHPIYDKLQKIHGDDQFDAIYGAGCTLHPDICFIFMNPTARNISSDKSWDGLKAPWIGTKSVWKLFHQLNLINSSTFKEIRDRKGKEWDCQFAEEVYQDIYRHKVFITNLAKCTQPDARHLSNEVFKEYKNLTEKEITTLNPKVTISFGNQVSSILLDQSISVSKVRRKVFNLNIESNTYKTFSVYYPVGQGMRNIDKSISDIKFIMQEFL